MLVLAIVVWQSVNTAFDKLCFLRPGQTDRQVAASGCKLNLRRNLRWVTKRTRKFPRKYTQVANKNILRQSFLYFIG